LLKKLIHATSLKFNIITNFFGTVWSAILSIIFIPIYLKYIGPEGYGIIGLFTTIQILLTLLDSGLSTTLNKEISRLSVLKNAEQEMHDTVKTLGRVYWSIAVVAGLIALVLSPILAKYWVHSHELSQSTITYAFVLLSISIVFQFPTGFYSGGILGLQKQVILNLLRIVFATLKSVGSVLILKYVSSSVLGFLSWFLFISILQAISFRYALWYCLPRSENVSQGLFKKTIIRQIGRFAAGLTAISLTSILLTQIDTIILSKILSLKQFGYYTLAYTVGSFLYMIVSPISQSYFPKFSVLITEDRNDELVKVYHQACQLVTLLVVPFGLFLAIFSKEILQIWIHNVETVQNTYKLVTLVTLAIAIHCLMFIPYMLCLAYKYTKIALYTNLVILAVMIPSTALSAIYFGGIGGASCWLTINVIYLFVYPTLIHNRFLKTEIFDWYWNDTVRPVLGCLVLFLAVKSFFFIEEHSPGYIITMSILTGLIGFLLTFFSSSKFKKIWNNFFFKKAFK
jgi:O-antigen/teichoic acid export membrane protein